MKIQSIQSLRDEMRAAARGQWPVMADAAAPSFESAEVRLRLLNSENLSVLALIDTERPRSMAQLAKRTRPKRSADGCPENTPNGGT